MNRHIRLSFAFLILGLLATAAGPALAADAPTPAVEADLAAEATPAVTPAEPVLDGALEQGWGPGYGNCALWCDGQTFWYYNVTRNECCSGTLTCPSGAPSLGYAWHPYQGYAEFCSI